MYGNIRVPPESLLWLGNHDFHIMWFHLYVLNLITHMRNCVADDTPMAVNIQEQENNGDNITRSNVNWFYMY